jgi:hypothetical protein
MVSLGGGRVKIPGMRLFKKAERTGNEVEVPLATRQRFGAVERFACVRHQ